MKKVILIFTILISLLESHLFAQVAPKASPKATVSQVVGLTNISLSYSRPGVKGRVIFGGLIPFGKLWRTGANSNSVITFEDDVIVEDLALKKGSYGIYTIPNKASWEVIFYKEINKWGIPKDWNNQNISAKIIVTPKHLNHTIETLHIGFDTIKMDTANLVIAWENTAVEVPITVPSKEKTLKNIAQLTDDSPIRSLFEAGTFYKDIGEFKKAKTYVKKALAKQKLKNNTTPFWMLRQQGLIYYELGDKKEAISIIENSLAQAKKAGNGDYIKSNTDTLTKWGAIK